MKTVKLSPIELNQATVHKMLPKRKKDSHKGHYGRVLLLCGSVGYTGAPVLAARAAARTGSGLIFVGVPHSVYPIVAGNLIEPMVFPLPDQDGMFREEAVPMILSRLSKMDACLIGCGMGQSDGTRAVVEAVLRHSPCPVILDADGINVLSGHIDIVRGAICPVILTPHEGEFLRIGGEVSPRLSGVKRMSRDLGATILLKGHKTIICGQGCYRNTTGNPGMATGGSGDTLSGIILSLLGQGLPPTKAAAVGAWIHGAAGDLCAKALGQMGMLPSDLIEMLPRLLP